MSSATEILELLDDLKPEGRCDDCLSIELDIQPRQSVNQVCRVLAAERKIERSRSACGQCGKVKITNFVGAMLRANTELPAMSLMPASGRGRSATVSEPSLDIEKARTEIVRICRTVWIKAKSEEPPRSLAVLINQLRNDTILPNHEANMMLTVCGLRNVYVYEGKELGARELVIAKNANAIIKDWWAGKG